MTPSMDWQVGPTYTAPRWMVVPDISDIEAISRHHLFPNTDSSSAEELTVTFLAEGSFNKIYTVDTKTKSLVKSYVFRVSLPVEPGDKVLNEVATLDYVKRHTKIPVPTVIAYDSSSNNVLGFEWILMEKIPGVPLSDIWSRLSYISKEAIIREIAGYVFQLRNICVFNEIGGLYHDSKAEFVIGPIVTQFMFMNGRRQLLLRDRGPYHHDSDFVRALIDVQIADIHFLKTMPSNGPNFDENIHEDGPAILRVMDELLSLVPTIFPRGKKKGSFLSALLHPDLSLSNIMIDPNTLQITGIIDWECTNASPLWQHAYPYFLTGPKVEKAPPRVEPGDTDEVRIEHWDHWEKVQLRAVFDEVVEPLAEEPLSMLKSEFMCSLDMAEISQAMAERCIEEIRKMLEASAIVRSDSVQTGIVQ